jgi:N-acetylglucosamine kinase
MTRLFLGIDGGATKTQAAIVDERGRLLGVGSSGSSNFGDVGKAQAQVNVGQATAAARHVAGVEAPPWSAAFLGLAGVVSDADRAIVQDIAQALALGATGRVGVDHDCRVALAGGLSGRPGIVLIAGTGSACYGRNAAAEEWRAGGWGHLISDEGSSYWFGVRAMQAAVRAFDGRIAFSSLQKQVLAHLGLSHMNEILHHLHVDGMAPAEIAALAPLVMEAARDGDEVALALIREGAQALADCVFAVARRLGFVGAAPEVALVGGLLQAGDIFLQPLQQAIQDRLPHARLTFPEMPPVLGACLLALQMDGIVVDEAVVQALHQGAARLHQGLL